MNASLFQAVVLGVVQGLTEFLPVSSSAHLTLLPRLFHWPDPGLAFDVALHLGTLSAVVLYFWRDLARLAESLVKFQESERAGDRKMIALLGLATVPAAVAGLLLEHKAETVFRSSALIAGALMTMGALLALADWFCRGDRRMPDLTFGSALGIGIAQSLALIPGVSRSGVTITMARVLGLDRQEAARFSFLLAIPIIAGAGVLKFKEILRSPDTTAVAAGFCAATVSGLLAIWILMRLVQRNRYTIFVVYRWALGLFVLLNLSRFS